NRQIPAWLIAPSVAQSHSNTKRGAQVPTGEINIMRKRPGLHLFASLIPATLMLGAGTGVAAQEHHAHADSAQPAPAAAVKTMRWSDPAAWPDGRVPGEGDEVMIPRDMDLVLDVEPPALRSLTIDG